MKFLLLTVFLLSIISCNTRDSDEIADQSEIYAKYKIEATKGLRKITGEVVFFEQSSRFWHDYIALRGDSYVEFHGSRMQEVRTLFDKTKYANNLISTSRRHTHTTANFNYQNNDGKVFINTLKLPPLAVIDGESIGVDYYADNSLRLKFNWNYENPIKCQRNSKCIKIKKYFLITATDSSSKMEYVKKQNVDLKIENFYGYIKSIQMCSSLTSRAYGAGNKNTKTSVYCDEKLFL